MKDLSDLITERAEKWDMQIARASKLEASEIEWIKYKEKINHLPDDWETFFAEIVGNYPGKCKKYATSKRDGSPVVQIICRLPQPMEFIKNPKFQMELVVNTDGAGNNKKAYYVGFNDITNTASTRWLLKPE